MKWILCGLTFALAVALAVTTAAIRADNIRLRQRLEREYRRVEAREMELRRLSLLAIENATPERLAAQLRELLEQAGDPPAQGAGPVAQAPRLRGGAPWQ